MAIKEQAAKTKLERARADGAEEEAASLGKELASLRKELSGKQSEVRDLTLTLTLSSQRCVT